MKLSIEYLELNGGDLEMIQLNIRSVWGKLPSEIKVAFYYVGVAGIELLAQELLGLKPIVWDTFFRVFVGNVLIVFIKNLPERVIRKVE